MNTPYSHTKRFNMYQYPTFYASTPGHYNMCYHNVPYNVYNTICDSTTIYLAAQPPCYVTNTITRLDTNKQNKIVCANCGCHGHIYKHCNHPITSFGVICFRMAYHQEYKRIMPQYLMVQRKDSLSYVEFMRGKYNCEHKSYLIKLFSNMTECERSAIMSTDFDTLWKRLWQIQDCNTFIREYNDSKAKFNKLKHGFHLKSSYDHTVVFFDINYILNNSKCELPHTEWGFPKGRRNINEDDFTCAFREFIEETGMLMEDISYVHNVKPFEEVFSGSNHVRYKHIYYLAATLNVNPINRVNPRNKTQCKEVKDMKWLWYDDAQSLIRSHNVERKELFRRVHSVIMKNIFALSSNSHVKGGTQTPRSKARESNTRTKCNRTTPR